MNKRWVTIGAALILSGCGSEEVKQSKFDLEQRRQIEQENAVREARVRQEQDELARMREQGRKRDQAAQRAAQTEVPVILLGENTNRETEVMAERLHAVLLEKPCDLDHLWHEAEKLARPVQLDHRPS